MAETLLAILNGHVWAVALAQDALGGIGRVAKLLLLPSRFRPSGRYFSVCLSWARGGFA
ncbi:hypothetical protein [Alkalilimnicola ehrlichii]|nr:hypothetical protein [Alkalilimnicola ehrlichii]